MRTGKSRAGWVPLLLALAAAGCQEAGLDVSLTSNATQVALGGSATVAAVVVDQDGDPVGGIDVVFSTDTGLLD